MSPEFSEFSYSYAVTEAVIRHLGRPGMPPLFPSLLMEARVGFDVAILGPVSLIFFQYKVCDGMVSKAAWEANMGLFTPTFYRMSLRRRNQSDQHKLLCIWEANGFNVKYVAPAFHLESEFIRAYANDDILKKSIFINPSAVGLLPDDQKHHVAFQIGGPAYFCSDPRRIHDGVFFGENLQKTFEKGKSYSEADIQNITKNLLRLLHKHGIEIPEMTGIKRSPLRDLQFLTQSYLGCVPVLIPT